MKTTQKQIAERVLAQAISDSGAKGAFSKEILTTISQTLEEKAESDRYVDNPALLDAWAAVVYHLHRFHDLEVDRYSGSRIEDRLVALGKRDKVKV
jgi:hypothetical protein